MVLPPLGGAVGGGGTTLEGTVLVEELALLTL